MAAADLYAVLGVTRDASVGEIRKAYKRLARRYHPDVNPGDKDAEERFKQISEAHAVLTSADQRAAYDRPRIPTPTDGRGRGAWAGMGVDLGESGLGDIFAEIFRGRRSGERRPIKGESLEATLRISFLDALRGLVAPLSLTRLLDCPTCATRAGASPRDCPACAGHGRQPRQVTIQVKIPAGVPSGARLRVAGKGHDGPGGPGNLHVTVQVLPHPVFERRGDNIHLKVPITLTEAALGARIEVPTVEGRAMLQIPAGTQPGQQLRLRGKGAPSPRGRRGDQVVELQVMVPGVVDEETRRLLRQLDQKTGPAPRDTLFRSA